MSTVTDEIAGRIDERVERVRDEMRRLEAAKAALLGHGEAPRPAAVRRPASPRVRRGKKSAPGSRLAQVLALVEAKPGIRSREIVRASRLTAPQAYNVIKSLRLKRLIVGGHNGWTITQAGVSVAIRKAQG